MPGIMGAAKQLDKEIADYLVHLSTDQKKVVLSVVKSFAREEDARWDNQEYIAEMDRRFAELESGKVKGISLDALEAGARKAYSQRKVKGR